MAEKTAEKEKIFTIPLREAGKKSLRKRTPYAARLVRSFLETHMKSDDVRLGQELNKAIWARGRKHPPRRVRVKAVLDSGVVKAEIIGYEYKEFKANPKAERKGAKQKLLERLGPKAAQKQEEEKKIEGKEGKDETKKPEQAIPIEQREVGRG
jgi:large subunit ribosomal protein L31e